MYKLLNNHFCCSISVSFNGDFKQLLDSVCNIQNNQGRVRGSAEADNPYRELDYSGHDKNRI